MKNTCERLLDEIGNYIRRLTVDYHLEICICDFKLPAAYHRILTTFGGHVNEYCRQTKTAPRGYNRCLWMQKFVREKCKKDEPFFGTCYAGVSEFVFPIVENGQYYGFISVSGYRLANRNDASYQTLNPTPPAINGYPSVNRAAYQFVQTSFPSPYRQTQRKRIKQAGASLRRNLAIFKRKIPTKNHLKRHRGRIAL